MSGDSVISNQKIGIIYGQDWGQFTGDLIEHLRQKGHEVRTPQSNWGSEYTDICRWADLIWLEWANEQCIHATANIDILQHKPTVCRIHGYELFYGFLNRINWSVVDRAVFVSDYMKRLAARACPDMVQKTRAVVIPNGVNLDKFPVKSRGHGFNLAVVGAVAEKKNPALWVEIAARLSKIDPRYTIKVAGEISSIKTRLYLENIIGRLDLGRNIIYHGYVDDIPAWFDREDINYIISTSYFESFGYSIAEGMALGCMPLIYHFPGAEETWPQAFLFKTVDELTDLIRPDREYDSRLYRSYIEQCFSLARQMTLTDDLLAACTPKV